MAQTWDVIKLKQTSNICLQGEAELWWNNQLDNVLWNGYLATPGIDEYCGALER